VNWYLWWGVALASLVGFYVAFADGIANVVSHWSQEEYSHGYIIPVVSLLIAWHKRDKLAQLAANGSWAGLAVIAFGLGLRVLGDLGSLYVVIHAGIFVTLTGILLAAVGWRGLRILWVPLVYLLFMFPVPDFFYNSLSLELQLISSSLGVWFIRLLGISVFLDGNIIDMGIYQLQVVEACSGLRYLFPLMSFGFIGAYFVHLPIWQKTVLFLSTIPLTIAMNSFRIAVIGVLVKNFGVLWAEGFLHYFEGWVIFMACALFLFVEAWLLSRLLQPRKRMAELVQVDIFDNILPRGLSGAMSIPSAATIVSLGFLLVAGLLLTSMLSGRQELVVDRTTFATFPLEIGKWHGGRTFLEKTVIEQLSADDFVVANYRRFQDPQRVNFYVAYYKSQRAGSSAHSPEACLPGGGWKIEEFKTRTLNKPGLPESIVANRVIITKGNSRQLVYYWFKQRNRYITNSYAAKWYLFVDSITRGRTDGALVRLMTFVDPDEEIEQADQRLLEFLKEIERILPPYIPD
jgi:exosortase D (VPLPA-CTERM-specific)